MVDAPERPRDIDRLRHVPVFALRELVQRVLGDDSRLADYTGEELLELVRDTPQVTQSLIDELYEEFRYGRRASFYLHLLEGEAAAAGVTDVASWNAALSGLQEAEPPGGHSVQARDTERLRLGISEIRYAYETVHEYIEPEHEAPARVTELNFGFLWLNTDHQYMVVMSKLESVTAIIARAVEAVLGCAVFPARLPKTLTDRYFAVEDMTRGSYHDGQRGVRHSIAAEQLFQVAAAEVTALEERYPRTTSLHRELVRANLESKLGLHLRKGKVYLTRTIRASDLREWMYTRLHPFAMALRRLEPQDLVLALRAPLPDLGLSGRGEAYFRELVSGVLRKQKDQGCVYRLTASADLVHASMRTYFIEPKPLFLCKKCGEMSPVCCPDCGSDALAVLSGKYRCKHCGATLICGQTSAVCARGDPTAAGEWTAELMLYPKRTLLSAVARCVDALPGAHFNPHEEFFWLEGSELHYSRTTAPTVALPAQISEYAGLPQRGAIADDVWEQACDLVRSAKEKCTITTATHGGQPRTEDCEECYEQNPGRLCIPKLFRALDAGFAPTPHGVEFGDVRLALTIDGIRKIFVGICKRATSTRPLRLSDKKAKEILCQVVTQALRDERVQAFGIIVPGEMDAELQGTVELLAKGTGKAVVFFGPDELALMCCALLSDPAHSALKELCAEHARHP